MFLVLKTAFRGEHSEQPRLQILSGSRGQGQTEGVPFQTIGDHNQQHREEQNRKMEHKEQGAWTFISLEKIVSRRGWEYKQKGHDPYPQGVCDSAEGENIMSKPTH